MQTAGEREREKGERKKSWLWKKTGSALHDDVIVCNQPKGAIWELVTVIERIKKRVICIVLQFKILLSVKLLIVIAAIDVFLFYCNHDYKSLVCLHRSEKNRQVFMLDPEKVSFDGNWRSQSREKEMCTIVVKSWNTSSDYSRRTVNKIYGSLDLFVCLETLPTHC